MTRKITNYDEFSTFVTLLGEVHRNFIPVQKVDTTGHQNEFDGRTSFIQAFIH